MNTGTRVLGSNLDSAQELLCDLGRVRRALQACSPICDLVTRAQLQSFSTPESQPRAGYSTHRLSCYTWEAKGDLAIRQTKGVPAQRPPRTLGVLWTPREE